MFKAIKRFVDMLLGGEGSLDRLTEAITGGESN